MENTDNKNVTWYKASTLYETGVPIWFFSVTENRAEENRAMQSPSNVEIVTGIDYAESHEIRLRNVTDNDEAYYYCVVDLYYDAWSRPPVFKAAKKKLKIVGK